jgi:DNA repair exonuclease SbcCD ATPase subunit
MESEVRLQRIENKLDQLSELVGQIARVDERVVSIHKRLDRHEKRLDWLEEQKRDLETVVQQGSAASKLYERAGWIVFSALVAFIATYMVN